MDERVERHYFDCMSKDVLMINPEVTRLIAEVIGEQMRPYGPRVHARAGEDHDGDPVIFVDVEYDLSDTPVDLTVTSSLTTKLRDRLWDMGETRFPHIRHKFDENQTVAPRRRKRA
jgi:hypothetical protein